MTSSARAVSRSPLSFWGHIGTPRPGHVGTPRARARCNDHHVLVTVDDTALGHDVTSVGGFAEAARSLTEPGAHFDALLLHMHLDDEHTGFDLFEQLLQEGRGRERRIMFTTGDSISARTRDQLQRSERPGLRKRFSLGELREMLNRVAGG